MIGISIKIVNDFDSVLKAADKASYKSLGHAAASIRKAEIASIIASDVASAPGTPPHTRKRVTKKGKPIVGYLPRAITFANEKTEKRAYVGPRASIVGTSAKAHEFGGEYKGEQYPQRPFAAPALEANLTRFAEEFSGSIGE